MLQVYTFSIIANAAPGTAPGWQGMVSQVGFIALMMAAMYMLLIRPQKKRTEEHRKLISQLKAGDNVLTSGGIHGTISGVSDDILTVRIANGVEVKFARAAIAKKIEAKS